MEPRVLRTPDAAQYVGLSVSTLEKMRLYGGGPRFVRIGVRAVGYCIDDLDAFIEAGREGCDGAQLRDRGEVSPGG